MKNWLLLIPITLFLVSCQSAQWGMTQRSIFDWQYSNLRLLDPSDTTLPENDLIAFYARMNGQSFQIRIDFLDFSKLPGNDIYIAFDTNPGGRTQITYKSSLALSTKIEWDYLIKIPASGKVEFIDDRYSSIYGTSLYIIRDRTLDGILISFNPRALAVELVNTKIQVLVTPANQSAIADQSEPFSIDAPSPARAKVLFVFWNTFKAATPAQALRSWDGAHSGPMRNRHGLRYLLDAAAQTRSNVALLDLPDPGTLSALDYLDKMPWIQSLSRFGYIDIPGFVNLRNGEEVRKTYISVGKNVNNNFILFILRKIGNVSGNDYAQFSNNCPLLPNTEMSHDSTDLFSFDCKKLLLSVSLQRPTLPIIFGGDFANSVLGIPSIASDVFSYIKSHPWIQLISLTEYLQLIRQANISPPPYYEEIANISLSKNSNENTTQLQDLQLKIYNDLLQLPDNPITNVAWNVFDTLSSPEPNSPSLTTLRSNYIGQIGEMIAGARWVSNPSPISTCDKDLDYDGSNECILANNNIFTVVEPEGGIVPFVFTKDNQGAHQIIGPTWEFIVGLSDPSTWVLSSGLRSDSDQLLGALSDPVSNWNIYNYILGKNSISLFSNKVSMRKTVSISSDTVQIDVHDPGSMLSQANIPLALDPWLRYTPGWGKLYESDQAQKTFVWKIQSGISVEIDSTSQLQGFPFNATRAALNYPENPNYDYSLGHYLPFPMALVKLYPSGEDYSVKIIINPQ